MTLSPFIPIRYIIFLVLGISLGYQLQWDFQAGIWISGISLILLGGIHFRKKRIRNLSFEIIAAICLIGIGINAIALRFERKPLDHYSRHSGMHNAIRLQVQEELRSSSFNNRFIARVKAVDSSYASGKILLYTPDSLLLLPDSEILVTKSWQPIRQPLNPGQFDYRNYMALQRIYDEVRISRNDHVVLTVSKPTLMGQLGLIRHSAGHLLLKAGISPATVATTEALLLGQRQHLDGDLYDAYKDAGAVHILAVSGLHIGILVMILKFLSQPLRRFRHGDTWQFLIIILFLWIYALFTGMSPSVLRAVTLFSFISYAWMIHRPTNMYNTLALSFFFILLVIQPSHLFQAGFQMSYTAVLAIIWIYPKLMRFWRPQSWILKRFWQLTAVSLSAQLGVLPISLYYFHQFPGLFFLSNLMIVPCLGIVLGVGIVVIVMTQLGWHVNFIFSGYDMLIKSMNAVVEWIGSQDAFIFRDVIIDIPRLVLLYGLIITFVLFLEQRKFKTGVALAGFALLFQIWISFQNRKLQESEILYIMHAFGTTILLEDTAADLRVYTDSPESSFDRLIQDYQFVSGRSTVHKKALQNAYQWRDFRILIIDGSGIIPENKMGFTHILLRQSPRIHLDRILSAFPSAEIIADGSNYPSFVERWRNSCMLLKRSFYYTGENGAYRFQGR